MQIHKAAFLACLLFSQLGQPSVLAAPTPSEIQAATRINVVGSELLLARLQEQGFGNSMVSSTSLFYALAALEKGAAGRTRQHINALLLQESAELSKIAPTLSQALIYKPAESHQSRARFSLHNSVWANSADTQGTPFVFAKEFLDEVAENFDAEARSIDFLAANAPGTINSWAEQVTDGLIDEIVDAQVLAPLKWLILNAAYFEGGWASPMSRRRASAAYTFTLATGEKRRIEHLYTNLRTRVHALDDGSRAFALGFSGRKYALIIHTSSAEVGDVETWIRADAIPNLPATVQNVFSNAASTYDVSLRMPSFNYSDSLTFKKDSPTSEQMGLAPLFRDDANYSRIVDTAKSHPASVSTTVGFIKQDTRIELDENGVKAAAVTAIAGVGVTSAPMPIQRMQINVDRPFVWSIVDVKSGTMLFNGILAEPSPDKDS